MPEDGYANLQEALVSPTLDDLRKCKAGVEYKEPEELKRLIRGISSRDLVKNGRMLVFSATRNAVDEASKLETTEEHQQDEDGRTFIWSCSVFCRVVPGVWVLVSHCGSEQQNYLCCSLGHPSSPCVCILELDEDTWFASSSNLGHYSAKAIPPAVLAGIDRHGRKQEEFRWCHCWAGVHRFSEGMRMFSGTKVCGLMWFGPFKKNISPADQLGRMLAFAECCIAKGLKSDNGEWYEHKDCSDDEKRCDDGRHAWRVKNMERWWMEHWLLDKQHPQLHTEEFLETRAENAPLPCADTSCSQPTDELNDDPLEGIIFLMSFMAGCALWKMHKQHTQAVRKAWQNLLWNGLDLVIFAAWTAMYLGYVVSKDRVSFLGICGMINATGMWILAGGLVQAWENLGDGNSQRGQPATGHERVVFWVLAGPLPLAVFLPLALLTKGSTSSLAITVCLVLTHLLMISVSKMLHAYTAATRYGDLFIFPVLEGLSELVVWKLLTGCSWSVLSMMLVGHIGSACLVDYHTPLHGGITPDAQKGAEGVARLARLGPQLLFFADMPACDGPAASLTTQFLAVMVATMSSIMVIRTLMPHKASTAWKVPHQQRAARRQDWWESTRPAHRLEDHMHEILNVDVWSAADLHRKVQDKEAKRHLVAELLYDCAQVAVMSWVEANISLVRSDFTGKLAVDFLNWMSTGVDILMMKGPQAFVKSGLPPNPIVDMVIEAIEDADAAEDIE